MSSYTWNSTTKFLWIKQDAKMDNNHLRCIFYKDPHTAEIFAGVFAKDQFMKKRFKKALHNTCVRTRTSKILNFLEVIG